MKANWKGIELDARAKKPLSMQEAMGEVLKAREAEKEECRAGRGASTFRSKADPRLGIPDKVGIGLGKGCERTAKRILVLLVDGPMRPSALREAVGIKSPIHFSRCYLRPLMEKGMIERTDPDFQPRANHRKPQPIHNHDSTITSCANG